MAAASSSDQCHHCKAYDRVKCDCGMLAQKNRSNRGKKGKKAKAAILCPIGVPTTRPPPTATLNVTSRKISSSWLRTWSS